LAYVGNIPAEAYISLSSQTFTTINGTAYALTSEVTNSEDIALFLNDVRQKPSTYTATGTTLTMGTATTTSDAMYCVYLGKGIQTVNPPDNSVSNAKLTDDAVGVAELSATGTPDATTYLRGDNSWSAVAADTNDKVRVSADDTTPGYLNGKLVAGTNITLTEGSGGGDETLTAAFSGNLNTSVLNAGTLDTARLGSGTADATTFLRGDQSWAAPGGGKVLQVVTATDSANYSVTSTSFVNSSNGLTVDITPSSATSKIFVQVSIANIFGQGGQNLFMTIYRDSTNLGGSNGMGINGGFDESVPCSMSILDSPATTSATTYQVYSKVTGGTSDYGNGNAVSTITAFEIGA